MPHAEARGKLNAAVVGRLQELSDLDSVDELLEETTLRPFFEKYCAGLRIPLVEFWIAQNALLNLICCLGERHYCATEEVISETVATLKTRKEAVIEKRDVEPRDIKQRDTEQTDIEFVETKRPLGDGVCSDDSCPCSEVSIRRGTGYLYISQEFIDFHHNTALRSALRESGAIVMGLAPILVCEQGAKLRGLDLEVAAADAKHWWKTGLAPLRVTPTA